MDSNVIHPLLIPHVLEQIFRSKTLTDGDLLTSRSVCREWRIHATKEVASRSTMLLEKDKRSEDVVYSAVNLIQNPNSDLPIPVRLGIASYFFDGENLNHLFETFLNLVAHHLEEIGVMVLSTSKHAAVSETFGNSMTFPKLRSLELTLAFPRFRGTLFQFATRILTNSPQLKDVKIVNLAPTNNLMTTIGLIPSAIQNLTLHIENTFFFFYSRSLVQQSLPNLKNLNLVFKQFNLVNSTDFCRGFNGCKNQLEKLSIDCCTCKVGIKFPRFERLTSLTIQIHTCASDSNLTHEVENFSQIFPEVSSLISGHLENMKILEALFPRGFHAPQVKSCILPEIIEGHEMMRNFSRGFSNLKSLTISPLRVSMFSAIFENMTGLEELFVFFKEPLTRICVDSVLTGISKQDCRAIRAAGNYDSVNIEEVKKRPGIPDLRHLKVLEVRHACLYTKRFFLTDITGYLGFLRMDNLKQLKTHTFNLTPPCIERLKERFGGDEVIAMQTRKSEFVFEYDHSEPHGSDSESDAELGVSETDPISEMDLMDFGEEDDDEWSPHLEYALDSESDSEFEVSETDPDSDMDFMDFSDDDDEDDDANMDFGDD